MKSALTVVLFRLFTIGVFVDGKEASIVSVMEGDSVTLKSGVTDVQTGDDIECRFNGKRIDKFVDGLQLDSQTGDLKISNIRTKDSGLYKVQINRPIGSSTEMEFNVKVSGAAKAVILNEGDFITLLTDVPDIQRVDEIRWRFGQQKSSVAEINRMGRNFIRYDGPDGRFRDRLELDNQTGSLIITNTTTTDSGLYEADISSGKHTIHKSFSVTVRGEMKTVSVKEGESVTLQINVTKIQSDDLIVWMFGNINLAEFNKTGKLFTTSDVPDRRFRLRLDLDHQNGSLIITDTRTTDSGDYQLKIISSRHIINRRITVTVSGVFGESVSVKEGDSVTLSPELSEIKRDDVIDWRFRDSLIARVRNNNIPSVYEDALDGKFRGRLKLNGQTGDLTITNFRNTDAGDYEVSNSINTFKKTFSVSGVFGDTDEVMSVSVMEGNRVTLNAGVTKNPGDVFLWYFEDTLIALVSGHPDTSCLYYGVGEIFKDRLDMDHKTGSLTITTSRPEHTGRYEAEFIEEKPGKTKTIIRRPKCDHRKTYPKGSDLVIHKSFSLTVSGSDLQSGSGLSSGAVVGIVLLAAAVGAAGVVGVMYYRRKNSEPERQKEENGVNLKKEKTDDSATEKLNCPPILETENSGSL